MPPPLVVRQLAFVKYVYGLAVNQSHQPGELGAVATLLFHDSVELFLQLVANEVDANVTDKTQFIQYFDEIQRSPASLVLGQRQAMQSLNKARVAFKHGGSLPSATTIEIMRANVQTFFEENTRLAFGIEFEAISLLDLVPYPRCKMHLQRAAESLDNGDYYSAFGHAHIAFKELLIEFGAAVRDDVYNVPFFTHHSLSEKQTTGTNWAIDAGIAEDNRLIKVVNELQEAMQVITLGIPYRKHAKFMRRRPWIFQQDTGEFYVLPRQETQLEVSKEYAQYCCDFVVETAIGLQTDEREITSP